MLVGDLIRGISDWHIDEWMTTPAGQVVGMIDQIKPARQVVFDIVEEARDVFDRITEPVGV